MGCKGAGPSAVCDSKAKMPRSLASGLCPDSFEICADFTFPIIFSLNTYFLMAVMISLPTHSSSLKMEIKETSWYSGQRAELAYSF